MRKRSRTLLIACAMILALSTVFMASAYVHKPWKIEYGYATYKWGSNLQSPGSVIRNGFESATSHISNASSKLYFGYSSSSSNTLNSFYTVSSTLYGNCTTNYSTSTGLVNYFTARLNAGNSNITASNVAQSTAVHELLHAAGLDHSTSTAVMNTSRNRSSVYTMQTDDHNGINAKY